MVGNRQCVPHFCLLPFALCLNLPSILSRMPVAPRPSLLDALRSDQSVLSVELRPPRAELDASYGMDAWIDTYHAVKGLVRSGSPMFLTDSAVGAKEENNLRHLVINLSSDVPRAQVVP